MRARHVLRQLLAIAALTALFAAGCSSDEPGDALATGPTSTTPAAEFVLHELDEPVPVGFPVELAAPGPRELRWILPWGEGFVALVWVNELTPFPELTDEQTALIPVEILELFEDDPPESVEEATARVIEANLSDAMLELFESHRELEELILGAGQPPTVEAWTTTDGLNWQQRGDMGFADATTLHTADSDGERLIIESDEQVAWTTDLEEWTALPVAVGMQGGPDEAVDGTWVTDLAVDGDRWAVATRTMGPGIMAPEEDVAFLTVGGWTGTPSEHAVPNRTITDVALVDEAVVFVAGQAEFHGDFEIYRLEEGSAQPELLTLPEGTDLTSPYHDLPKLIAVEDAVILVTAEDVFWGAPDGSQWTPLELPGLDLATLMPALTAYPSWGTGGLAATADLRWALGSEISTLEYEVDVDPYVLEVTDSQRHAAVRFNLVDTRSGETVVSERLDYGWPLEPSDAETMSFSPDGSIAVWDREMDQILATVSVEEIRSAYGQAFTEALRPTVVGEDVDVGAGLVVVATSDGIDWYLDAIEMDPYGWPVWPEGATRNGDRLLAWFGDQLLLYTVA